MYIYICVCVYIYMRVFILHNFFLLFIFTRDRVEEKEDALQTNFTYKEDSLYGLRPGLSTLVAINSWNLLQ